MFSTAIYRFFFNALLNPFGLWHVQTNSSVLDCSKTSREGATTSVFFSDLVGVKNGLV